MNPDISPEDVSTIVAAQFLIRTAKFCGRLLLHIPEIPPAFRFEERLHFY
ncbi:hypothetical protein VB620_13815 [Nodularia harveyana UHCC-0300]|uniref:Uncharacterized protein n=1 Tax=Nodularia harveyana UHCC-0300 TaxID=2974287 RepID=A0ABU5UFV9_9CYAN|nr:hypothetical protein [Nodularia harveyana]MEA5582413.1 hypothetical protein [Nodularia harveyana UHCC-0300]